MKVSIFSAKVFALSTLIFLSNLASFGQSDSIYLLRAGTKIKVRMDTEISSKVSSANDTFLVRTSEPVSNRGSILLPAGTIIEGRVLAASPAGFGGIGGKLDIRFDFLRLDDEQTRGMDARMVTPLKAPSRTRFTAISIAGLTAAGTLFGAVSGAENGALLGAAIGAGSGTGLALARKGSDVRIKDGEEFEIELKRDLMLPVTDF